MAIKQKVHHLQHSPLGMHRLRTPDDIAGDLAEAPRVLQ